MFDVTDDSRQQEEEEQEVDDEDVANAQNQTMRVEEDVEEDYYRETDHFEFER